MVDLRIYQGDNTNTEETGNRARGLPKAPRESRRLLSKKQVHLSPRRLFEVFQPVRTQAPPSPTARVQLHMYMYVCITAEYTYACAAALTERLTL